MFKKRPIAAWYDNLKTEKEPALSYEYGFFFYLHRFSCHKKPVEINKAYDHYEYYSTNIPEDDIVKLYKYEPIKSSSSQNDCYDDVVRVRGINKPGGLDRCYKNDVFFKAGNQYCEVCVRQNDCKKLLEQETDGQVRVRPRRSSNYSRYGKNP